MVGSCISHKHSGLSCVLPFATMSQTQGPEAFNEGEIPPVELGKGAIAASNAGWAQQVAAKAAEDRREQPWKAKLGTTHDREVDGEDWISLQRSGDVQSLAA